MKKEYTEQQDCFAMVSASRITSSGQHLFGSEIKHNSLICLRIKECHHARRGTSESYHDGNIITEVYLTPLQWAEMLTNMNTLGVPCTLTFSQDKGKVKPYNPIKSLIDETYDYSQKAMQSEELNKRVQDVRDYINDSRLSKKAKEELRVKLDVAFTHLESNARYFATRFSESATRIVTESKAAVEANRQKVLEDLGLVKIAEMRDQKLID